MIIDNERCELTIIEEHLKVDRRFTEALNLDLLSYLIAMAEQELFETIKRREGAAVPSSGDAH